VFTAELNEAARWGDEPPDYVVRSHRHRAIAIDLDMRKKGKSVYAAGIVTAGWQGKTPFCFKIAGGRMAQPQFGGLCIRTGDEEHYYRRLTFHLDRPEVENE
jgi:hypothetical protein